MRANKGSISYLIAITGRLSLFNRFHHSQNEKKKKIKKKL